MSRRMRNRISGALCWMGVFLLLIAGMVRP